MGDVSEKTAFSVKDVSNMQEHAELINGNLVITDKTTVSHGRAIKYISRAFEDYISSNNGTCEVFNENIALYCDELCNEAGNFYLPDVMVVCDKSGIKEDGIHTVPRFIAEITSPATRKADYNKKKDIYSEIGVPEYWIIDLQKKLVIKNILDNDVYLPMINYGSNTSVLSVDTYPGLEINLSKIFE